MHNFDEILLLLAFLIIVILPFVYKLYLPILKGKKGEAKVRRQLNKLPKDEYYCINDILIKTNRGYCQIDHIVISIYGIYVIETKNYTGWIYGHENSEKWTQSIYGNKTKFRNPIKQNWGHIYAIRNVLSDYGKIKYYSIVVFAGTAILKNVNSIIPVIYSKRLYKTIIGQKGIPSLSIREIEVISNKINEINIQGRKDKRKAKKELVKQIKTGIYERNQKEKRLICPSCGGNLILRKGKYGKFYGCSNYPKCKYSKEK